MAKANEDYAMMERQFGDDPIIKQAWEQERRRKQIEAARYISELIGKTDINKLRDAVAPENLKDVLLRSDVGYEKLMMIGEGQEEIRALAERRKTRITKLQQSTEGSTADDKGIFELLRRKAELAEEKLLPLEQKTI